jgi:hypothetical protein
MLKSETEQLVNPLFGKMYDSFRTQLFEAMDAIPFDFLSSVIASKFSSLTEQIVYAYGKMAELRQMDAMVARLSAEKRVWMLIAADQHLADDDAVLQNIAYIGECIQLVDDHITDAIGKLTNAISIKGLWKSYKTCLDSEVTDAIREVFNRLDPYTVLGDRDRRLNALVSRERPNRVSRH